MKKIIIMVCLACFGVAKGATLQWYFDGDDIGNGVQDGWLVAMYQDVDGLTDLSSLVFYSNDSNNSGDVTTSLSSTITGGAGNHYWESLGNTHPGGMYAYSVIFNAASLGSASQFLVVDATPFLIPSITLPTQIDFYTPTTVSGTWQNIQAVPEPATFLLFGMGGLGAWLIRRKQRIV
jgi:hypothetical protein